MESNRIVPDGAKIRQAGAKNVIPCIIAVLLIINGLFNFTTVVEAFIYISIISAVLVFFVVFIEKEKAMLTDSLSISVFMWCFLVCLSSIWAVNASGAFVSIIGYSGAFFLFVVGRAYSRDEPEQRYNTARMICYAGAVISFLSIEMASTGVLWWLYSGPLAGLFRITEATVEYGTWVEGARIRSLMGLPNIYATFSAMCFFISLQLVSGEQRRNKKPFDLSAILLSGTGFFLSGSRGGLLAFCASIIIFVLYTKKGNRIRLLMEFAFFILWCGATYLLSIRWMGAGSPMVWVILGISAFLLSYCWIYAARLIDKLASMKPRVLVKIFGAVILAGIIFTIIAVNVRTPYTMDNPNIEFNRAVRLDAGIHELDIAADFWDGCEGLYITIKSQNGAQAARQTYDLLLETEFLSGEWQKLSFTVPDGAEAVFLTMRNIGNGSASITGISAGGKKIPLEYNLIPEALISRLQGIWVDANILQRFVYWEDGLQLFKKSPVIGLGGGAFEMLAASVSDSYYVSKHVHNHYIQIMVENGIIGLIVMLTVCVITMTMLWRKRNVLPGDFVPCVAAAIAMMLIHSVEEASMYNILNIEVFFLLLGLVSGACSKKRVSRMGEIFRIIICLYAAIMTALLGGRLITQQYVRTEESKGTKNALASYRVAVITDPLNASAYKSACLTRYVADPSSGAGALSAQFVRDLEQNWNSPKDCYTVGRYYLKTGEVSNAVRYFERYVELCRVNPLVWDEVFSQYYKILRESDDPSIVSMHSEISSSAGRLIKYLNMLNDELPEPVTPNAAFLRMMEELAVKPHQ